MTATSSATRIRGNKLSLKIAATEFNGEAVSYELASTGDDMSFAEAAAGGRYSLKLTVRQDLSDATSSLYRYLWANAGTYGVACILAPYGNATASATQPQVTCSIDIPATFPTLGGDAGTDGKRWTTEIECMLSDGSVPVLKLV